MQIILLIVFSVAVSLCVTFSTQWFRIKKREKSRNIIILTIGVLTCIIFSILIDSILTAGRPTLYFHTHKPGRTTLKMFSISTISGGLFYALILMVIERKKQKKSVIRWLVRSFLVASCGTLLLEVFYFNFRHFELVGSNAPKLEYGPENILGHGMYFNRASQKFHPYNHPLEPGLESYVGYKKVRNIYYELDAGSPQTVVRLKYNDETHRNYVSIPDHVFNNKIPRSYYIPLHTVGVTYSLLLNFPEIIAPDESFGISLKNVSVNTIVPLEIKPVRIILCFLIIFMFTAFFPGSPLWTLRLDFRSISQMIAIVFMIIIVCSFFAWTVFSSYTSSNLPITKQKAALNENYQQYDKLVDALLVPRYALLDNPHPYLEKDGDPYDMQLREKRQFDYPWDTAYYNGQYYVYFGVVPAVSVLMPYKLLTGNNLDLDYPILAFSCLFIIGLYGVYSLLVNRYFPNISFGLYWTGLFILLTALNLSWCLRRTLVYELAITSGICFAVWGIFFILLSGGFNWKAYICCFLSGMCTALSVGCRPTQIFVSVIVIAAGFLYIKENGKLFTIANIFKMILFLLPYAAIGLALMKYNYERFNDPFEFGITYQLTTENRAAGLPLLGVTGRMLSILSSLFTLPHLDLNFPFIHIQVPNLPYNGFIQNSDMVLGVFSYPVMAFLFIIPAMRKCILNHGKSLMIFCITCLIAGLSMSIIASDFAVANRYLTDYLYLAAIPSIISLFCFYEKTESAGMAKLSQFVILACMTVGLGLCTALSFTGEENWFQSINPLYYEKLRYWTSPWL